MDAVISWGLFKNNGSTAQRSQIPWPARRDQSGNLDRGVLPIKTCSVLGVLHHHNRIGEENFRLETVFPA